MKRLNLYILKTLSPALLGLLLIVGAPYALAAKGGVKGKPGGEDPPPPIDGSACQNSSGVFPAIAYSKIVKGGRKGTSTLGYDIYVANNAGDCEIKVIELVAKTVSFHFDYGEGIIAYSLGKDVDAGRKDNASVVRFARFEASNKVINTPLPLATNLVHKVAEQSTTIGISDVEISPDGQQIAISEEDHLPDVHRFTIRVIDIANCVSNCTSQVVFSELAGGQYYLAWGPQSDRLYFSRNLFNTNGSGEIIGSLAMIEDTGAGWSSTPSTIIDQDYFLDNVARRFYYPTVAMMDHNNDDVQEEVVALHIHSSGETSQTVDIIDIQTGDIVRAGFPGTLAKFSSSPSDGSEVSLLFSLGIPHSPYMTEVNPDSGITIRNLGSGAYVDSAD